MANQIYLTGNITRDTIVVPTKGMPMAFLHIAAEREWDGDDGSTRRRTAFTSVVCFGELLVSDAVRLGVKGRPVAVDGSLRTRQRTSDDGTTSWDLEVVADAVHDLQPPVPSRGEPAAQPAAPAEQAL